jgi:hypothetical protein
MRGPDCIGKEVIPSDAVDEKLPAKGGVKASAVSRPSPCCRGTTPTVDTGGLDLPSMAGPLLRLLAQEHDRRLAPARAAGRVAAIIGCDKQVIGNGLGVREDARRTTEVGVAVPILNLMPELGPSTSVRIACIPMGPGLLQPPPRSTQQRRQRALHRPGAAAACRNDRDHADRGPWPCRHSAAAQNWANTPNVQPPSTRRLWPWTWLARSEQRNSTASAICCAVPHFPFGVCAASVALICWL